MNRTRRLALATAAATIVLFAVGGLVRGTGSGLGCSTWPECHPGTVFPTGTVHSLIEFSHRFLVFVTSVLVFVTAAFVLIDRRDERKVVWASLLAIPLVLGQAVLGGIVVHSELNPNWVTAHFAVALAFVADIVFLAALCSLPVGTGSNKGATGGKFARMAMFTTGAAGVLLLVGTYVRAKSAGLAFTDWPLMNGKLVPALGGAATAMFLHRVLAALVMVLVIWLAIRARASAARSHQLVVLTTVTLVLFLAQIVAGAANVISRLKPWAVVTHVALSVLIWAALVALTSAALMLPDPIGVAETSGEATGAEPSKGSLKATITAYVQLTKPRIIVLLLITTVPAMILAQHGIPSIWLMLATLIGGTIAAGSANSINMYLDRDIDQLMKRTRRRPLPSHSVTPEKALGFGFVLGAISFFFLSITVNTVAASLAMSAIAFYVFIYTMWLKRTTAQNIVIGGAAGAVPALVGWAAVTGGLSAPAWILFAIIFMWTPPHFWALSMRFSGDYAMAGVPMLPVVKGEAETRRQIFLYSLVLFGTTLLLVPVAHMGPVYIAVAVGLGGTFVYRALRLLQDGSADKSWGLFKFSIYYLAALFGAVAVDALVHG